MKKLTLAIAANHPTGTGHFPGNPIIPGALLLAEVLHRITQAEGLGFAPCNVKTAKFPHPARPGELVEIEYSNPKPDMIDFRCAVAGVCVLSGAFSAAVHV